MRGRRETGQDGRHCHSSDRGLGRWCGHSRGEGGSGSGVGWRKDDEFCEVLWHLRDILGSNGGMWDGPWGYVWELPVHS